jgi:hypothetical protein
MLVKARLQGKAGLYVMCPQFHDEIMDNRWGGIHFTLGYLMWLDCDG